MKVRTRMCLGLLLVTGLTMGGSQSVLGQEKEHAVCPQELRNDVQKASTDRQSNEAAIRVPEAARDAARSGRAAVGDSYAGVTRVRGRLSGSGCASAG